mmetsp:Transcript_99090/g.277541  ORF Transcript_99090/g.277541 Transcript_99090/m.277541 type:complete len:295 (-) Transcript_99090:79-963(-)
MLKDMRPVWSRQSKRKMLRTPSAPSGLSDKFSSRSFLWLSKLSSNIKAVRKSHRFIAMSKCVSDVSRDNCSRNKDRGGIVSCAGQISVAAEQFATLRDRNEQLSVTRSPRNSKAEPSKQFQERSKVRIFLPASNQSMHRFVMAFGMSPVCDKLTTSMTGCLPMASHKAACNFVEIVTWLRLSSFSSGQLFTNSVTEPNMPEPPFVQRPKFSLDKLSKMVSVRSESRKLLKPRSVSSALSNKLTASTPSISSNTFEIAANSLSTRFLPLRSTVFECPVRNGMGIGTFCWLSHSFK